MRWKRSAGPLGKPPADADTSVMEASPSEITAVVVEQSSHDHDRSVILIVVSVAGCAMVVVGAFAPWIKASTATILGVPNRIASPSITLAGLDAGVWRSIFVLVALVGLGASWWCANKRIGRGVLLMAGIVTIIATIGVFHGHGYPFSSASTGPLLTLAGGLLLVGAAITAFLRYERVGVVRAPR